MAPGPHPAPDAIEEGFRMTEPDRGSHKRTLIFEKPFYMAKLTRRTTAESRAAGR